MRTSHFSNCESRCKSMCTLYMIKPLSSTCSINVCTSYGWLLEATKTGSGLLLHSTVQMEGFRIQKAEVDDRLDLDIIYIFTFEVLTHYALPQKESGESDWKTSY